MGSALAAPKPAAFERIDAAMWDDPQRMSHEADRALLTAAAHSDSAAQLNAALMLAVASEVLEHVEPAQRALAIGMPLAQQLKDDGARCQFFATEAFLAQASGRRDAAIQQYIEAIAFATRVGIDWCLARLHSAQGGMYSNMNRSAEAVTALIKAHDLFEAQHDKPWIAVGLSDLCWVYHRESDNPLSLQRAIDSGEAALSMLDPPRQRFLAATVHHNLAGAYFVSHRLPQARDHIQRALEFTNSIGDAVGIGYIARLHGQIEMDAGHPDLALALFDQAKAVFLRYGIQDMLLGSSVRRVQALTALRRRAEALQELEAAERLRKQVDTAASDILYYETALHLYEKFDDFEHAFRASESLRAAQQRQIVADNHKSAAELQERFETQSKEAENGLLRGQRRASESQRWLLLVTLTLSLALLAVISVFLFQQLRQRRRFAELAARDDLTGIPNRRSILEIARKALSDRRSACQPVCIALLDIDNFKSVNDTYGHTVGDAALKTFARVCTENLRGQDQLGRFGGEEFLLILPGASTGDMPDVFERLRSGLRAVPVPRMPPDFRLEFSMGCTPLLAEDELEHAIHRADEALYRAKSAGRDRVEAASASQSPSELVVAVAH
jgi:diguanylate cyclase (GGDEF)-like protein